MNQLFEWEHGLYSNGGGDGTAEEARKKCYDVLLQKLHKLIELKEVRPNEEQSDELAKSSLVTKTRSWCCTRRASSVTNAIVFTHHSNASCDSLRSSQFDAADEMMSNAICSEDNLLHSVLYDNLLKTKQIERLIRIQSPRLEKFLNDVDKSLLWRFYVFHGRHSDACVLMSTTGLSKDRITLDERIACFTRAVNSAVAMSGGGAGANSEGGEAERSMKDCILLSIITNNLLLLAAINLILYPNPFRDSLRSL